MEINKTTRSFSVSAKFPFPSILGRVFSCVQFIFSGTKGQNTSNLIADPVSLEPVIKKTQHDSLIGMLNEGKNYDEASLIMKTAEDWNLDVELLDPANLKVNGKSVWIEAEE